MHQRRRSWHRSARRRFDAWLSAMSHLENRPGWITSLLSNRSDRGVHPEPGAEYPGRSSPDRSYQHLTGYPPRQERLRSRSAADFRKFGLFGLKLARDHLAGGSCVRYQFRHPLGAATRNSPRPPSPLRSVCHPLRSIWEAAAAGRHPRPRCGLAHCRRTAVRRTAVWSSCRTMACAPLVTSSETRSSAVSARPSSPHSIPTRTPPARSRRTRTHYAAISAGPPIFGLV